MSLLLRRRDMMSMTGGDGVLYGYDIVGDPVIQNNVMTPTETGYVTMPFDFNPGNSTWVLQFAFTPYVLISYQNLFGGSIGNALLAQQNWGLYRFYLGTGGTGSFDIVYGATAFSVTVNTDYILQFGFDGTKYYARISSDDGATWAEYLLSNITAAMHPGVIRFGQKASNVDKTSATFDLTKMMLWVDDQLTWRAVR